MYYIYILYNFMYANFAKYDNIADYYYYCYFIHIFLENLHHMET